MREVRGKRQGKRVSELETKRFVFVVVLYLFVKRGKEGELASLS